MLCFGIFRCRRLQNKTENIVFIYFHSLKTQRKTKRIAVEKQNETWRATGRREIGEKLAAEKIEKKTNKKSHKLPNVGILFIVYILCILKQQCIRYINTSIHYVYIWTFKAFCYFWLRKQVKSNGISPNTKLN